MQIELSEIVGYLPYGLNFLDNNNKLWQLSLNNCSFALDKKWKPILHPLSELTKEIEVNGEKFVPIEYNAFKNSRDHLLEFQNGFAHYKSVKYGIIQRLYEWHFDIHNLINRNLAIDINTI